MTFEISGTPGAWTLDFGDRTRETGSGPTTIQHTYGTGGRYTALLTSSGCSECSFPETDSVDITVAHPPPTAQLTANPTSGPAPLEVIFNGSGSSASAPVTITSWTLTFGDGGSTGGQGTPPASIPYTYKTPGTYTATLTVFGSGCDPPPSDPVDVRESPSAGDGPSGVVTAQNHCQDTDSVRITVFERPTATLTATPQTGPEPLTVSFNASGTPANARWTLDFGDGTSASGTGLPQTIVHTYDKPGTYTATLTVSDPRCDSNPSVDSVVSPSAADTPSGVVAAEGHCSATASEDIIVTPTVNVTKTATPTSRPEPGGQFTFDVVVTNTGRDPVTLTALTDDVYGDLNGRGTCATGEVLDPGESYACSFSVDFTGNAGRQETDTVTATVVEDEGISGRARDSATISLTDVPPTLRVTKLVNPTSRPAPGGNFDYVVLVDNTSFEPVTLTALTDDVYGDLNGRGTCATGVVIAPGSRYTCVFRATFTGSGGDTETDTVTATVRDDDGTSASASDSVTVSLTGPPTTTTTPTTSTTTTTTPDPGPDPTPDPFPDPDPGTTVPTTTTPTTTPPPPTTAPPVTPPPVTAPPATAPPATAPPLLAAAQTAGPQILTEPPSPPGATTVTATTTFTLPTTVPVTTSTTTLVTTTLLTTTTTLVPAPTPPTTTRALEVDKPSASPGDEIVATGRGCDPGAPVTLRILGRVVGTTVADAGGRFTTPLRLPQLEVGRYELEALCGPRLTTFIDIVVVSRVDQGAAASVVMVMFVMTGVFYLTSQMGDRRRP